MEKASAEVLDAALAQARRRGRRLFAWQRALIGTAATGGALVAVRGLVAVGAGPGRVALAFVLLASAVLFVVGLRARARMERLGRDVQALEIARDALDREPAPRVELHPYRVEPGRERHVLVVHTEDFERLLRRQADAEAPARAAWIARVTAAVVVVVVAAIGGSMLVGQGMEAPRRWTFVGDAGASDLLGFRAGSPRAGAWAVAHDEVATGARSIVNRAGESAAPAATLVARSIRARDVRAVTRCRVGRSVVDGACGVVFRYVDDSNHHLVRVEAGTGRVALLRVIDGSERVLATAIGAAPPGIWQELSVEAHGDGIRVSWNGEDVIDVNEVVPSAAGSVGLWAPSETEAYFDELAVDVLPGAAQTLEVLPLLGQPPS